MLRRPAICNSYAGYCSVLRKLFNENHSERNRRHSNLKLHNIQINKYNHRHSHSFNPSCNHNFNPSCNHNFNLSCNHSFNPSCNHNCNLSPQCWATRCFHRPRLISHPRLLLQVSINTCNKQLHDIFQSNSGFEPLY